jgi:hypothetical protein
MNVEIATLCEAATDQGGRLNLLGAFDRLDAPLPLVLQQCAAVFRVRYQRSEAVSHTLTLSIENIDGTTLVPPLVSHVDLIPFPPDADSAIVNMILNMHRLRIDKPGKYLMRLRIDQIEAALLPLYVRDSTPKEPNPLAN